MSVRCTPWAALLLVAAGAGLGVALGGCGAPEARFSTIAELPDDLRSAVLLEPMGASTDGFQRIRIGFDQRVEGDLPERPLLIPFTDERPRAREGERGRPVVAMRIWPLGGGGPKTVPAIVDTGAASTLILSLDTAHEVDVWLSAEIGPHDGIGFVGPVPSGAGLARRVEIGPVALAPAEVKVNTSQRGHAAALGLSAFMAFGGLVFDWENHVIVAMPRGRPIRVEPGWAEVSWLPAPEVRLEPVGEVAGGGADGVSAWSVSTRFPGTPVVQAAIAGRSLRAVLDTGGDGDLASLQELSVTGRGRSRMVASHGRVQRMREHTLDGPVMIGPVRFDHPSVVVPDPERKGNPEDSRASLQFFDAVVGVELLRQQPVWFDFERGVVRFWMGQGPLPALTGSRVGTEGR